MNNVQAAWQASRAELEQKERVYTGVHANVKQLENEMLYAKNCLNAFREQVANLLSDGFVKVEANEDKIKESIKLLMTSSKDRGLVNFDPLFLLREIFLKKKKSNLDDRLNGWQNATVGKPADRSD
jgi:hypothetical protein